MAKKTSAWVKHVTSTYKEMKKRNRNAKLGDAMKAAKKTYKKQKGGSPAPFSGGNRDDDDEPEGYSNMTAENTSMKPAPFSGGSNCGNKSRRRRRSNKRKSRKNRTRKSRR